VCSSDLAFHRSELEEVNDLRTKTLDMARKKDINVLDDLLEVIRKRITANNLFDRNQTISLNPILFAFN
jgi:hypothetical protein